MGFFSKPEPADKSTNEGKSQSHEVKAVAEPNGHTSNYYDGVGRPDGPNHTHTVVNDKGNVTYHREGDK